MLNKYDVIYSLQAEGLADIFIWQCEKRRLVKCYKIEVTLGGGNDIIVLPEQEVCYLFGLFNPENSQCHYRHIPLFLGSAPEVYLAEL